MHPVLFHLGNFAIHVYGIVGALAVLAAGAVLRAELERLDGKGHAAAALTIAGALGGFAGARIYYLAEHLGSVSLLGSVAGAGFTWYGGVIGGGAGMLLVARRRSVPLTALLGAAGPTLALGYGLGRIACQFAGDGTYGKPSNLPWAMSYPHGEIPTTQRVHPTPIYETLTSLLIFGLLWRWRRTTPPVKLFGYYLLLAGLERFLIEFLRRNDRVLLGLTQPQFFALALMLIGGLLLVRRPSGRDARWRVAESGHRAAHRV